MNEDAASIPHHQEVLQNVQHARHLRKNKNSMIPLLQPCQQFIQDFQLAASINQVFPQRWQRSILDVRKEVGVVAALPELHHEIQQGPARFLSCSALNGRDLPQQALLVDVALDRC